MKRILRTIVAAFVVVTALVSTNPARAQWVVSDPIHTAETILQYLKDAQQYVQVLRHYEQELKRLEDPSWRDVGEILGFAAELAEFGESIGFAGAAAIEEFVEFFPPELILTLELLDEGLDAHELMKIWTVIVRDTTAGSLGVASAQAQDVELINGMLLEMQAMSNGATGNGENLHLIGQVNVLLAQEVVKTNQLLSAQIQMEAAEQGRLAALEGLVAATNYEAIWGGEDDGKGYDDYPGWR